MTACLPLLFSTPTEEALLAEANATLEAIEEEIQVNPQVASAAIRSTAKLISALVIGVVAARQNILNREAIDSLARLVYWVFEPALMMCSVSQTLNTTADGLSTQSLFVLMPLVSILHTIVGYVASITTTKVVPMRSASDARDLWMCVTFSNSATLPLVFASSLFPHGSQMQADLTACISFYLLVLSPIFYTLGTSLLMTDEERKNLDDGISSERQQNATFGQQLVSFLAMFWNPPVLGSVLGVAIGFVPILRDSFLGNDAWGAPMFEAMKTFGTAYLPSTILVLAGSMGSVEVDDDKKDDASVSLNAPSIRKSLSAHFDDAAKPTDDRVIIHPTLCRKVLVGIFLARFVLFPAATVVICNVLLQTPLLSMESERNQAVLLFVIYMQGAMPPAQNSVLLLQLADQRERAKRMTKLLTIMYLVSVIPVTILMSQVLSATKIMQYNDAV